MEHRNSVLRRLDPSEASWLRDFWRWYWPSFSLVCLASLGIGFVLTGELRVILLWLATALFTFALTVLPAAAAWGVVSRLLQGLGAGPRVTVAAAGVFATAAVFGVIFYVANSGVLGPVSMLAVAALVIGTMPLSIVGPSWAWVQAMKKPAG